MLCVNRFQAVNFWTDDGLALHYTCLSTETYMHSCECINKLVQMPKTFIITNITAHNALAGDSAHMLFANQQPTQSLASHSIEYFT